MDKVLTLAESEAPPDGYVLALRPDVVGKLHRYAVAPRPSCTICHGRGVMRVTVKRGDVAATEVRPCQCVDGRLARELAARPEERPLIGVGQAVVEREEARRRRLRDELAREQTALVELETARDRAMAPHLELAAQLDRQRTTLAEAQAELLTRAAQAVADLEQARERFHQAGQLSAELAGDLAVRRERLQSIAAEYEAAKAAAEAAVPSGHRHKMHVARGRVATLLERLDRLENGTKKTAQNPGSGAEKGAENEGTSDVEMVDRG